MAVLPFVEYLHDKPGKNVVRRFPRYFKVIDSVYSFMYTVYNFTNTLCCLGSGKLNPIISITIIVE